MVVYTVPPCTAIPNLAAVRMSIQLSVDSDIIRHRVG